MQREKARSVLVQAVVATLLGAGTSHAAVGYTYTPSGAADAWSTGSGWDAPPV